MKLLSMLVLSLTVCLWLAACGESSTDTASGGGEDTQTPANEGGQEGDDHAHDETSLGSAAIGEMQVEFAQGHGVVAAGQEGHLVVKLPYNDNGASVVRAWIGTADRTLSFVGKGEYAPSHDDYDVHAMAPDTLPEDTMWWIEVEKPDGTKVVGSIKPIMD